VNGSLPDMGRLIGLNGRVEVLGDGLNHRSDRDGSQSLGTLRPPNS
jgi:hypothetical protein